MAENTNPRGKVRVVKNMLDMFKRQIAEFSQLDKSLKDSEMYINLVIKDWSTYYEVATSLNNEIIAKGDEADSEVRKYFDDDIFAKLRNLYLAHSSTLHGLLKIIVTSENHDLNVTHSEMTNSTFQKINVNFNQANANASQTQNILNDTYNLSYVSHSIPDFDGDYDKWPDFKDSMEGSVNENHCLTNNNKLQILLKHLKGEALKVVRRDRSKLLAENYNNIWDLLTKRYDHKRSLIYSYFHLLLNQEFIEKESSSALKQIYDNTYDTLSFLRKMNLKVDDWDDLLVFIVYSKLPLKSKELWDEKLGKADELPSFETLMDFIETRFRVLEGVEATRKLSQPNHKFSQKITSSQSSKKTTLQSSKQEPKKKMFRKKFSSNNNQQTCKCCNKSSHALRFCKQFQGMSVQERIDTTNHLKYCYNCLGDHLKDKCESEFRCGYCGFKHHTMLHLDEKLTKVPRNEIAENSPSCSRNQALFTHSDENVFFPTTFVLITARKGAQLRFRAIVDSCADLSYISENAVSRLQLKRFPTYIETAGLGNSSTGVSKHFVSLQIGSIYDKDFHLTIRAYVVPQICEQKPSNKFCIETLVPNNIELADYNFNVPGTIDLLLGGAVDSKITLSKIIKSVCGNVIFRQTRLGYIANGVVPQNICLTSLSTKIKCQVSNDIDKTLRDFWEIEEVPSSRVLTSDEIEAENLYTKFTNRLSDGRYEVSLPFKCVVEGFQNMRKIAFCRFAYLERKLGNNPNLKEMYQTCINEYISMGHMYQVNPSDFPSGYYLPHHCVLKESSSTTKLRVVFDASARDTNLESLNEKLYIGPRLQADLLDLILRFRTFKYAFNADIEKMYRQIFINKADHKYQLLLWRNAPNEDIKTYAMNRVTFGTSPAPFLAVRTLYKLAEDEKTRFPIGAKCLESGFYVDDLIYGADTLEEAVEAQNQTINILKTAGFHLRKWSANHNFLLKAIPEADRETKSLLSFEDELSVKTLGIQWNPKEDNFHFKIDFLEHNQITKRTTLSDIAKLFDPLGWMAPAIVLAKKLIQDIWLEKLEWDTPLPLHLRCYWSNLKNELEYISKIRVPRWVSSKSNDVLELHGFGDASEMAYAAVIYLKVKRKEIVHSNLLISKTKIAPVQKVSIPRLELCAATLLAKLINHVATVLNIESTNIFCWSDSTITLSWINDSPHKRTTYVANRITEVQRYTKPECWRHIGTKENPADLASRGVYPLELEGNKLWWHGPDILQNVDSDYKKFKEFICPTLPQEENKKEKLSKGILSGKQIDCLFANRKLSLLEMSANLKTYNVLGNELLNKYSTLAKAVRIIAYCRRVIKKNRIPVQYITPIEYELSLNLLIKMVQNDVFWHEINDIEKEKPILKSSKIYQINPFIDKTDGLLRVDGRLSKADHLNYNQKFPIILPYNHQLTNLLVREAHVATLHGTLQETHMFLCQKYHIIRCKILIKKICKNCVVCHRFRATNSFQQMGQLPRSRISPERPFANCGIDFAGPFELKKWKGKCNSFHKSYFAIYICFATKAIHLEVVIDLSTAAFIASYRRFISRRGVAKNIYTDNGTNFVGSMKTITMGTSEFINEWNQEVAKELANFKTNWHFNPPSAPHFGGLWERGVQSVKHHTKRIMSNAKLTYDEFETLLLQIESSLNSRPLMAIDNNPDTVILTPGHFLIGEPLNTLPDHNLKAKHISIGDRWNYIQHLFQEVWRFWSSDYLNCLRDRQKWRSTKNNIKINDVVLIKDDNLAPNFWLKGLVIEVYPDKQGFVRVALVKTKNSTLKRPIVKLSPLPINDNSSD